MSICGNMVGGKSPLRTVILTDENGNEIATGVVVDQEVVFTATDNDVREGMVYASDSGVSTGTKTIPSYHTSYGYRIALENSEVKINVHEYEYNYLTVIIATYNNNWNQSLSSTYVSIGDGMYAVGSDVKISDITIDAENEEINLGITVPEKSVVRYLVTREEF